MQRCSGADADEVQLQREVLKCRGAGKVQVQRYRCRKAERQEWSCRAAAMKRSCRGAEVLLNCKAVAGAEVQRGAAVLR